MRENQMMNRSFQKASAFDQLPVQVQAEIKYYLAINDFRTAKAIYDKFIQPTAQ